MVVLFADLVGFTGFSETREPEVVRAVLTAYFEQARDIISRFGGDVEKFIGDAVMAVWGATVMHEDDAERAVRAGLELTDMVARLGNELEVGPLSLRVGVLSGEASVAPTSPEQGFIVGDLVNTASRLQSMAEPGTVVVGAATHRLVEHAFRFEELGSHPLKGKSASVAVWRAVAPIAHRGRRTPGGVVEPAFVGREEELRLLKDALHATEREGRARLVSLVGEAGIGKTRLADELREYASGIAAEVRWHDGRSPAYDQGLPFWALGEMVRQRAGIAETDDPLRSRTKLRTAVAEYVPSVADQEWIEPRLAALLGLDTASAGDHREFFAAIRSFFQHIAERGTTLLVFEDFHWADAGLIGFVRELVESSPRHPILVLTLARPDLLDATPGWGVGHRNFTSVHLGPLADAEMSELITGMVQGIGTELAAAIKERANGIALYAVELVRMLIADGDLVMGDDVCCVPTHDLSAIRVPDTVRAVIGARLDRLPAEARELLQDAAVLGAAFTQAGLAAVTGLEAPQLEGLLGSLVHRELLEFENDPRSPGRGKYRFVQTMIREVAYGRLTRDERRARHVRAAEFLADTGESELAGAVASHYMAAHQVSDSAADERAITADAVAALTGAAERAAGIHSHAQALAMIEQALSFTAGSAEEPGLWQRAARSASALARHDVAIGYARRALDWQRVHGGSTEMVGAAVLAGDVLCSAFRAPEAIEVLEPVIDAGSGFDDPAVVAAGAQLARAYLMALRDGDAARMSDSVIGPAERLDLIPTIVDALITRGTALGNLGRMYEAIALLQGATRYSEEYELPLAEMRAINNLGHLLAYDDHPGAMDACRRGLAQANRLGDVRFIGSFAWAVAAYLDRDGRFDEGQALRDEVRDRLDLPPSSLLWYELTDLVSRVERGDSTAIDPAFELLHRSIDDANPQSRASAPVTSARLNLLTGQFETAYEEIMGVADAHRFPDHLADAMIAAAMLGDLDRLEVVAEGVRSSRIRGRFLGSLHSAVTGSLAAVRGDSDGAVAGFSQALAFRYLRLDRANLQALFATLVGRDVPIAREASDEAFAVLTEVGAGAYLDLFAAGMPPADAHQAAGG